MRKITRIVVILIVVAAFFAWSTPVSAAGSQPIIRTFQPSTIDSYIGDKKPNDPHGSDPTMDVQSASVGLLNYRSVVQFDLSQIPTGSTVSSATLSLYASAVPVVIRTYYAHVITTSWGEGTVTWNSPWTVVGGDFNASTVSATTPAAADWMNFDVTSDVISFVGGTANYGWLVKDSVENSGTAYGSTFYTKEEATQTALRPKLAVTFTPVWDSYKDSDRTTVGGNDIETQYDDTDHIVYMEGTGFLDGTQTYTVGYYDGGGTIRATDNNIALVNPSGGRGTLGNPADPFEPTYDLLSFPAAAPGTWHAVVQPFEATGFPTDYSTLSADPDAYQLLADDTFLVDASAIPEFSTVMAAIGVAGLCFGIYFWMRKRFKKQNEKFKIRTQRDLG